jgi:phospholipase/carboxylesterase
MPRMHPSKESPVLEHVVIQQPQAEGPAQQLILLAHGLGADEHDLVPLGEILAQQFPNACVVSLRAPFLCDFSSGYQWFSVQGVSDDNRDARVADALPAFTQAVQHWQQRTGASADATCLVGFSQGAILALESTQLEAPALAGRVVALSGRMASPPRRAPPDTTLHLVHGKEDAVIHYGQTVRAAEALLALGADVTADVIPFLGHGVNEEVVDTVLQRLTGYVPKRRWQEAMRSAP